MGRTGKSNLTEQPEIIDLLQVLMENGLQKEKKEVESLVSYLDNMQEEFGQVLLELQEVKGQLQQMQESKVKLSVRQYVNQAEGKCLEVGKQFDRVRKKGKDALRKVVSAMKIPNTFMLMEKVLHAAGVGLPTSTGVGMGIQWEQMEAQKVKTDLEKRVESLNLGDRVFRIVVPEEETVEIRRGKKKKILRKLFPGYVMLEMLVHEEKSNEGIGYKVDSEAWYVIRNTNGVTGFVGVGSEPTPLEEKEVENLLKLMGLENEIASENREIRIELGYEVGDVATIVEGAFAGSHGKISEIHLEQKKVKVMIDVFGRMTPVE